MKSVENKVFVILIALLELAGTILFKSDCPVLTSKSGGALAPISLIPVYTRSYTSFSQGPDACAGRFHFMEGTNWHSSSIIQIVTNAVIL